MDEKEIIDVISASKNPVKLTELVRRLRIKGHERRQFRNLLKDLEKRGKIRSVRGKNYTIPSGRSGQIVGTLSVTSRGFGFVRPDWTGVTGKIPFEGDLFIPARNMGAALDGDIVHAEILRRSSEGVSGKVTEVVEHVHKTIVGRYQRTKKDSGWVIPRNSRLERRILVPAPHPNLNVKDFEWVEVEITEFTEAPAELRGTVIGRLGSNDDKGIDILLVLRDLGIYEEFPDSVEQEVKELHFDWENDLKDRVDYRETPTITIDPKTAKDFDDGLSIEQIDNGAWRLYVHIADVAHFLKDGTALDREAIERSTSVYPVDRVVPMLPSKLSNFLCSLRPNEDRLTMTAVLDIDIDGKLLAKKVHSSVIHSDYRFTYEEVQEVFDGKKTEGEPYEELVPILHQLRKVASVLRKQRFRRGALDLDIPESTILFDESGAASDIKFYPRYESHQLVEECMLIANEAVAQFLTEKKAPLLYRIHEVADQERLEQLIPVLGAFNIKLKMRDGEITPHDLQDALVQAQKHPAGHILRRLVLRALKRAEYDPVNVGHFGLASECYCHFTSPIRRYPDVVVHRQVKSIERGEKLFYSAEDNELDMLGDHTSGRERRAQEAEMEATTIKSLEYMKAFEGEEFDGFVSGVQNFGVFIELVEYPVEGFIRRDALGRDRYELDELGIKLIGQNSGHTIKLGDKIRVYIDKVEPLEQRLDLSIVHQEDAGDDVVSPAKGKRKKGRR